jgi:diguanylate cyclase (GGDEF)-like protein/PAS domain S-box-containing protein
MTGRFVTAPWIWGGMILFHIGLVVVALRFYDHQSFHLYDAYRQAAEREVEFLAKVAGDTLQQGSYSGAQRLLAQWAGKDPSTHSVALRAANGFLIGGHQRGQPAEHRIAVSRTVAYSYRGEAELTLTKDLTPVREKSLLLALEVIGSSLFVSITYFVMTFSALRIQRQSQELRRRSEALNRTNALLQEEVQERIRAERELRRAAKAIENTSEAVVITDAVGRIIQVNDAYCRITGYSQRELLGSNPNINHSGRHDRAFYEAMWARIRENGSWSGEIWDRRRGGEVYPARLSIDTLFDEDGEVENYIAVFTDISQVKANEEQLERLAFYDALTGLPNRTLFRDRLEQGLRLAARIQGQLALLFIDLDRFKPINDTLGHDAGDLVLKEVARRLKGCVRSSDTVARLGGDEFTVILSEVRGGEEAGMVAQKIIDALGLPMEVKGEPVTVGGSLGIAVYPKDGNDFDSLTKNADDAMYRAKEDGRNRFHFFTEAVEKQSRQRLTLERQLQQALDRGEFVLHYQPKLDIRSGRVCGMEALVRWQPEQGPLVGPDRFIALADEVGLLVPLGAWIFDQVCAQTLVWRAQGHDLQVAVNFTARQLRHPEALAMISGAMERHPLPPGTVELELTEGAMMEDLEHCIATLHRLRALGLHIAVDDFGTGYSSLQYLKNLPIDTLKIDRSFLQGVPDDPENLSIVSAVVYLGLSLNLEIVAEGVENAAQLHFLAERGCQQAQGYYIGPPMDAAAFSAYLAEGRWPRV